MDVMDWLLDSDPSIRWQVLRDLTDASEDEVATERGLIAAEGWGARLLSLRDADGQWAGGACFPASGWSEDLPGQPWTSTLHTLQLLQDFGLDPSSDEAQAAIALVRDNCKWEYDGAPFFNGEVEECINGRTVAIGAYFGQDVEPIVQRLLDAQLEDGGWNCWTENGATVSSYHSTICVLDGLLEYERTAADPVAVAAARARGEEYLLARSLFRRLSTGEPANPKWLEFSYPPRWHYDVLRGLDYFRSTGAAPDPRLADAIEVVRSKRQSDGRWLLENTHVGPVHFDLEAGDGEPSRWNTLRALRVLQWSDPAG